MYETASKLRDQEGEARQKDQVSDEIKSEMNTFGENCVQREGKQFTVAEKLEKSETLNREKDKEVNAVMAEVAAEKIRVEEATNVGVDAVKVDANISKNDDVKGEVEGVDQVDDVNFLEISGYVAKESDIDEGIGDNVTSDRRAEFMDLAK